jgi:amino-acid N-acetyltransferase
VIGLERFSESGLLRSLAVAPGHQHIGLGRQLVAQLEHDAGAEGIEQLVLLTQSAEPFFRRLGYQTIDRRCVPDELRRSEEFRSLCPANAVCMTKSLRPARAGDPRG